MLQGGLIIGDDVFSCFVSEFVNWSGMRVRESLLGNPVSITVISRSCSGGPGSPSYVSRLLPWSSRKHGSQPSQ